MTITEEPPATETPPPQRPPTAWRRVLTTPVLAIVAVVAMGAMGAVFLTAVTTGQDAQQDARTVASDTAPAVLTLDTLCKRSDQLGADLRNVGACGEKVDKAKQAVEGQAQPSVAPAASLSRDDVAAIVSAQLAGKTVSVDQVMQMVISVYNSNKPADGKPGPAPTAEQVLAAVQTVCGGGKCQGPKGDAAPPASPAEIFAQVAAFCASDGSPCRGTQGVQGVQGDRGPDGVSVTRQYFDRDDQGACRNFIDFSDGRTRVDQGPAGDAACPAAAPPPIVPTP